MQLWAIGIRKAKIMMCIMRAIKSVDDRLKILGTSKGLEEDSSDDGEMTGFKWCFIIDPAGKFSSIWALVITLDLMATGLYIPYSAAFNSTETSIDYFGFALDFVFLFDIVFGFFTSYRTKHGVLETQAKYIAFGYVKSWLPIDLLTIVPYDYVLGSDSFRFIKFIKFLKVFKFVRVFKYVNRIKEIAEKYGIGIITLRLGAEAVAVVYLVHIAAWIYYFVAIVNNLEPDTWVVQKGIQDEDNGVKYLYSVYWALQTLTTVGYGDIPADTNEEKTVAIFWMVFGVGFYSFTIGNLSSFITSIDAKNVQSRAKMYAIEEFSRKHNLPEDLEIRMKSFISNQNEVSEQDQKDLFKELPSSLKAEVIHYIHMYLIQCKIYDKSLI